MLFGQTFRNLEKIIEMITKARTKAEKRATDRNNLSSENTPPTSKVNVTHNTPEVTTPSAANQSFK